MHGHGPLKGWRNSSSFPIECVWEQSKSEAGQALLKLLQ